MVAVKNRTLRRICDFEEGELVYTYTVVFSNGFDVRGNVVGTAWDLEPKSPLLIVRKDGEYVFVICRFGLIDLHHTIYATTSPDVE